jgi:uncharacterized protein YyaL (SSP411 family)
VVVTLIFPGLLDLYECVFEDWILEWCVTLQETQNRLFWDSQGGGYFSTTSGDPFIILRLKQGKSYQKQTGIIMAAAYKSNFVYNGFG